MKKILLLLATIALSGCADPGALKRVVSQVANPTPAPAKPVLPPEEVTNYFKFHQQEVALVSAAANDAKAFNKSLKIVMRTDEIVFSSQQGKAIRLQRTAELAYELPLDAVTAKSVQANAFATSFGKYVLSRSVTEPSSIRIIGRTPVEADFLKVAVLAGCTGKISIEASIGSSPMIAFVSTGPTSRVLK